VLLAATSDGTLWRFAAGAWQRWLVRPSPSDVVPIVVPPAKEPWLPLMKKTEFRTLKLVLLEGQRVHINYLDKKGGKNIDNPQFFNLPDPDNNNSLKGSIAVMENGGTLTISCLDNVPCRVGQE